MATLASRLDEILIFPRTEESLDSLIAGDEESQSLQLSLDDGADIEQEIDRSRSSQQVQRFAESLPSREQIILRRIYHQDLSQTRVANELGVSQPMVAKILNRVHVKAREALSEFNS